MSKRKDNITKEQVATIRNPDKVIKDPDIPIKKPIKVVDTLYCSNSNKATKPNIKGTGSKTAKPKAITTIKSKAKSDVNATKLDAITKPKATKSDATVKSKAIKSKVIKSDTKVKSKVVNTDTKVSKAKSNIRITGSKTANPNAKKPKPKTGKTNIKSNGSKTDKSKVGFWDNDCLTFSNKLWKPPLVRKCKRPKWETNHPLLPIQCFSNRSPMPNIELLPVDLYDNSNDKLKKFNQLFGCELGRLASLFEKKKLNVPFFVNYATKLRDDLKELRKGKPKGLAQTCHDLSKKVFAEFRDGYSQRTDVSDEDDKTIRAHFKVYDSILVKVDQLDLVPKCHPVRLYPSDMQRVKLKEMIDNTKKLYNCLVARFKTRHDNCKEVCRKEWDEKCKEEDDEIELIDPEWGRKVGHKLEEKNDIFPLGSTDFRDAHNISLCKEYNLPNSVSADIIARFIANVKGNITKLKKGSIDDFVMQPKLPSDIFSVPLQRHYTSKKGFYPTIFGTMVTDNRDKFKWSDLDHDYKLVYNPALDRYYVHVMTYKNLKTIANRKPIAIMDPGSAVFQELYGLDHTVSIGVGLHSPIINRIHKIEYLQKRIDNADFDRQERAERLDRKKRQEKERIERYKRDKKEHNALLRVPKDESKESKTERYRKLKGIMHQEERTTRQEINTIDRIWCNVRSKEKRDMLSKVPKNESDEAKKERIRQLKNITYKEKKKSKGRSKKENLKRAIVRERRKIKGLISELHNKTCLYLCRNYDRVMVTNFSCKKVNSKYGKLHKDVKKVLTELSHYRFRQRLQHKCAEYRCQYLEVTEEYTSKTCSSCGNIKYDLGTARVYKCDKCPAHLDRDVNGSVNIFIKNRAEVVK